MSAIRRYFSSKLELRQNGVLLLATIFVVGIAVVGGGNTTTLSPSDPIVAALSLPLLMLSFTYLILNNGSLLFTTKIALITGGVILSIPLLQIVPLPPDIWLQMPGRAEIYDGFRISGIAPPWLGVSMSPIRTRQSFLSLIPPVSVFIAVIFLSSRERRILIVSIIGLGMISAIVGFSQATGNSVFRLYRNDHDFVGFFSNHNHLGALFYILIIISGTWATAIVIDGGKQINEEERIARRKNAMSKLNGVLLVFALLAMVLFIIGVYLTRSRAAIIICMISIFIIFSATIPFKFEVALKNRILAISILFAIGTCFAVLNSSDELMGRFQQGFNDSVRKNISHYTFDLAKKYFPFGAGFGTFIPIYAANETTIIAEVAPINRAHNDYVEWILEGGLASLLLICLSFLWLAASAKRLFVHTDGAPFVDRSLQRGALLGLLALLVHSAVDYPLRTVAISTIAAVLAGLVTGPTEANASRRRRIAR